VEAERQDPEAVGQAADQPLEDEHDDEGVITERLSASPRKTKTAA
jgi:hypothetical protein